MAVRRSNRFNPDVDQALLTALETVGGGYSPYEVEVFSGFRPGDPRFHGKHSAVDVSLIDPKTQQKLANYQDASTAQAYQAYANEVYKWAQKNNPELAQKLRWGGYFSGGAGKYGALDLMHFDVGGGPGGLNMAGGSWGGGWTPEMMDTWGLKNGGGVAGAAGGWTPEQIQKAFLDSIAQGESPGYDVMYGGKRFTDFSRHPHQAQTVGDITSDVAGRYQFKGSTWDELAAKYGYKDFSQANQDAAAWQYAQDIYSQKTKGGSLTEALQSNDPARVNAAAQILNQTWSSLPGGKEQAKGFGNKTFYDIYSGYLGQGGTPPAGGAAAPAAAAGGGGGGAAAPFTPAAAGAEKGDTFESQVGAAIKGMSGKAPTTSAASAVPQLPIDYGAGAGAVPTVNAQMAEVQRQRLAEAMARLNSGQLWG